jgi:long-subunit acyl-CoA synthetase (AMP-forming)
MIYLGMSIKIDHQGDRCDKPGEGEILCKGRHVMLGYLGEELKTKDSIDDDGYFHSGDIGRMDERGNVYITGRIKELIVSAGGGISLCPCFVDPSPTFADAIIFFFIDYLLQRSILLFRVKI